MTNKAIFIPRILLCGDKEEFFARVSQRPFEVCGQVKFFGNANGQMFNFLRDGKFLLNDKFFGYEEIPKIMRGGGMIISFLMTLKSFAK